ncbi:NUDIX domain-containing protein [Parachlamydia sp. AcF125]|uniref:NUDIX domain-containing protein n=1 Tax=Parachlamydia sp. AcF125 TaxID=2795736 RepID=UPI001BD82E19|nr:NUDIX domain-containing protein [Parachlamydia sp. AcF125]MBS4167811.1 CTP pyrophosphohydrolase [Parachlamydia sp. AcF125]
MSLFFRKKPVDFNSKLQVVTCFLECEGKILLLQRANECKSPGKWAIPGGKVKKGETLIEALERELQEELLIAVRRDKIDHLIKVYVRHSLGDYQLFLYPWKLPTFLPITLNIREHQAYVWQAKEHIEELPLLEGQLEAYKLVYETHHHFIMALLPSLE